MSIEINYINPDRTEWLTLCQRPVIDQAAIAGIVKPILQDVKENGDESVKKYAAKFDKVNLEELLVSAKEIEEGVSATSEDLKAAIALAKKNITLFHEAQNYGKPQKVITAPGVTCWRESLPIQKVGLYIPGGTAPLFSTLLMLAIPAQVAGCPHIALCTPSDADGKVNPAVLFTAHLLGLTNIYKVGGVQAIAALAYGTETIDAVNKIFGPGNQYVTTAKQLINSEGIAIDLPAGPSEVAVYADETAVPAFVAADLLSQAEHGADSQVMLVATSASILEAVKQEIDIQLQALPRKAIAAQALECSRFVVMENARSAFDLLNEYAPEHLIIASDHAESFSSLVKSAGSVFLGNFAPESAGDYASGTNHTLPTNGHAKAYSGVSVDSFVKKISFQQITKEGLQHIGPAIEIMANAEGLQAHKNAVTLRIKKDL